MPVISAFFLMIRFFSFLCVNARSDRGEGVAVLLEAVELSFALLPPCAGLSDHGKFAGPSEPNRIPPGGYGLCKLLAGVFRVHVTPSSRSKDADYTSSE